MSGYLLDTGVFLTFLDDPTRLSAQIQGILADPEAKIMVSAASFFEIAVKKAMKKAKVPENLPDMARLSGLDILDITADHSFKTLRLPYHHTDPYDRLILAQAACEGLTILTACPHLDAYAIPVLK